MSNRLLAFLFIILPLFSFGQELEFSPLPVVASLVGSYKGNLPCEDCKAIESILQLDFQTDSTGVFSLRDKYVSKQGTDIMSRIAGEWIVVKDVMNSLPVKLVVLNYENPDKVMYYLIKPDGNLMPLDGDKQKIVATADCTMKKEAPEKIN